MINISIVIVFVSLIDGRKHCPSAWHYLPGEIICILFGTSKLGDVSWFDAYRACQYSSGQLLLLHKYPNRLREIQQIYHQAYRTSDNEPIDVLHHGSWIGQPKWSKEFLCDGQMKTNEEFQLNCYVLIEDPTNSSSLCLKSRPCNHSHSFICQRPIQIEDEKEEKEDETRFLKCVICAVCCIVDAVQNKKESDAAKKAALEAAKAAELAKLAAAAAELEAYKKLFVFELPNNFAFDDDGQPFIPVAQEENESSDFFKWLLLIGGSIVSLIFVCLCCLFCCCVYIWIRI